VADGAAGVGSVGGVQVHRELILRLPERLHRGRRQRTAAGRTLNPSEGCRTAVVAAGMGKGRKPRSGLVTLFRVKLGSLTVAPGGSGPSLLDSEYGNIAWKDWWIEI
jgi:hypothetical protein